MLRRRWRSSHHKACSRALTRTCFLHRDAKQSRLLQRVSLCRRRRVEALASLLELANLGPSSQHNGNRQSAPQATRHHRTQRHRGEEKSCDSGDDCRDARSTVEGTTRCAPVSITRRRAAPWYQRRSRWPSAPPFDGRELRPVPAPPQTTSPASPAAASLPAVSPLVCSTHTRRETQMSTPDTQKECLRESESGRE
jgi:hypothetical protein